MTTIAIFFKPHRPPFGFAKIPLRSLIRQQLKLNYFGTVLITDGLAQNEKCLWFRTRLCGAWYNFGYLFGLACFFRGSGNRAPRRAVKSGTPHGGAGQ